jgi:rubredoxin
MGKANEMYQCQVHYCGYVYDPEVGEPKSGIAPGTKWEDVPEDFRCPFCGAGKNMFRPLAGPGSVHWENIKSNPIYRDTPEEELERMYVNRDVKLESPDAERAQ